MRIRCLLLGVITLLSACASRPNAEGWIEKTIETKYLSFQVWEKEITPEQKLRIYIEGDGNPTPDKPVAFELANRDTHQNVIYVSRPCQYVWCDECEKSALWQEERYNAEIVEEMKKLIDYLMKKYKAPSVELIGYDGGATMALLLAPKLPVERVITVGGIVNTKTYATSQKIVLNGDNPMDIKNILAQISQVHYVGGKDKVVPRRMVEGFVDAMYKPKSVSVKIVPNATHTSWENLVIE